MIKLAFRTELTIIIKTRLLKQVDDFEFIGDARKRSFDLKVVPLGMTVCVEIGF